MPVGKAGGAKGSGNHDTRVRDLALGRPGQSEKEAVPASMELLTRELALAHHAFADFALRIASSAYWRYFCERLLKMRRSSPDAASFSAFLM